PAAGSPAHSGEDETPGGCAMRKSVEQVRGTNRAPGVTRRRFLERAAGCAAGVLGAPLVVPASALGRGGRTAPSNRIVLAHIGVGGQGMQHVVGGIWT